jgi:NADH-quinone oxidoreductase subunit N
MEKKATMGLYSVVFLQSFTVFPEYFIAISAIYVLIVVTLITYNVYGLIVQRALSECMTLILVMACYLIINDDLMVFDFLSLSNVIINDQLALFTKFIVCFSSAIYFFLIADSLKEQKLTSFEYLLILLFAVLGLMLLCSSNDLLTAYLAIELTSLSSYILASFKKTSSYSVDAGIKYFITGAVSSAFFLLGSSLIYALSGSIYIADLWDLFHYEKFLPDLQTIWIQYFNEPALKEEKYFSHALASVIVAVYNYGSFWDSWYNTPPIVYNYSFLEFGLTLILFSLFIKLALAPFHLWSLDVYEGSPTSSTFFFAVIAKLSVFVFLLRLCYVGLFRLNESWQFYALWVGVLSVFVGSFGGIKQRKLKTLLAYSSTSHMGYALLAFSTGYSFGVQMLLFYLVIYIVSGLSIWSIILSLRLKKKNLVSKYNKELGDLILLRKSNAAFAFAFSLTMFSIAGIPPLIGFFAKMSVFLTVIISEFYAIALISILCSVVSTFYYIRIVKVLYFENLLVGKLYYPLESNKTIMLGFLIFLLIFLFANPTFLYLIIHSVVFESII